MTKTLVRKGIIYFTDRNIAKLWRDAYAPSARIIIAEYGYAIETPSGACLGPYCKPTGSYGGYSATVAS